MPQGTRRDKLTTDEHRSTRIKHQNGGIAPPSVFPRKGRHIVSVETPVPDIARFLSASFASFARHTCPKKNRMRDNAGQRGTMRAKRDEFASKGRAKLPLSRNISILLVLVLDPVWSPRFSVSPFKARTSGPGSSPEGPSCLFRIRFIICRFSVLLFPPRPLTISSQQSTSAPPFPPSN